MQVPTFTDIIELVDSDEDEKLADEAKEAATRLDDLDVAGSPPSKRQRTLHRLESDPEIGTQIPSPDRSCSGEAEPAEDTLPLPGVFVPAELDVSDTMLPSKKPKFVDLKTAPEVRRGTAWANLVRCG